MRLELLKTNRNFRYLWIGQLISSLGDRLTQMGILSFILISYKDDGSKMSVITFFSLLPFLVFGPLFGALADRCSRKNLMLFADIFRAAVVILIPFVWLNTHNTVLTVGLIFILGALGALFLPARMSLVTDIAGKDELLEANSLIVTTGMITILIGTLFAGVVVRFIGAKAGFYINSLTYVISALFILNIFYNRTNKEVRKIEGIYGMLLKDIKTGITYIWRHKLMKRTILLTAVFSIISSFAYILILNYSSTVLKLNPLGIGIMLSCAGSGMVVGSLILLKRKDKINYNRALYLAYLIIGFFCLGFIIRPVFHISIFILFCAGIGASIITVVLDTIMQRITPAELQGKISAARGVLANSVFLGSFLLVGLLVKLVPVTILFALIGLLGLITSLSIALTDKPWGYHLLRSFLRLIMRGMFGFRVSGLENLPKSKRVILAGNHTSLLDGAAIMSAYPERIYFLVADTAFKAKFWGWCMEKLGYIPVKRGGFNKEAIKEAIGFLKSGYSIGIFPEGKITLDGRLTEGREGVAVIAKLAGVDVIPFAIEGAYEAWPLPKKFPRRFPVEVRFGKPIDIKNYPTQGSLTDEIMQEISGIKLSLEREGYLRAEPNDIIRHLINIG